MSVLETNLKNTRPRPHHLETETKTTNTRSRSRRSRNQKKLVSRPLSLLHMLHYSEMSDLCSHQLHALLIVLEVPQLENLLICNGEKRELSVCDHQLVRCTTPDFETKVKLITYTVAM